jgi:gamma-glutamyltranspeptidase/glutathione hydrolase
LKKEGLLSDGPAAPTGMKAEEAMRDYIAAAGDRFAVASGCSYATAAAAEILERGGNVVDAALAGSAVLCVTLPHAVSIGGDLFALIKLAGRPDIFAVNATGGAPRRADRSVFVSRGLSFIPTRGPLSIQPPGLPAGWAAMVERWASMPLAELLAPAVGLARHGFKVGPRLARLCRELARAYAAEPGWSQAYLVDGEPLREGDILRQDRLSATLAQLGGEGARAFFSGPIAADLVASVKRAGGLLEPDDLECVAADVTPALCTNIGAFSIATQPPVSQGVVLLRAFRLLARAAAGRHDLAELWPLAAAAMKTAFAERLQLLGDSSEARARAESMLTGELPSGPLGPLTANAASETTTIAVLDAQGNAASLILSIFADFGSGLVTEETGILLNNRLSAFFLDPAHPNSISPRKRTIHTLHSVVVSDESGPLMAGGSPGGDNQPQVNLQVLMRALLLRHDLGETVAAPRWALFPGTAPLELEQAPDPLILCEPGLDRDIVAAFGRAGWRTRAMPSADIGSAKWVGRGAHGRALEAVCDTRRQGAVWAA